MERDIWSDRRNETTALYRRNYGRRRHKRRKFARLVYPPTAEPKVLNADFRVMDISRKGIKFHYKGNGEDRTDPIRLKSIVALTIRFHDGEVIDINVEILRCEQTRHSKEKIYAGFVDKGITAERIAKEQAYLLSHFPDFCRVPRD
jgi:hypothetical protein